MKELAVVHFDVNTLEVQTFLSGPEAQVLVFVDTFYPGWSATIDGQKTAIARADYNFKAVLVPAGRHKVRFSFQPATYILGCITRKTVEAGLLVYGIALIYSYRRQKKKIKESLSPQTRNER